MGSLFLNKLLFHLTVLPSVAVVILNWNGKRYLEQFLPSVILTNYKNLKIIIADNNSSDDSLQFIKINYPYIQIIELKQNHGFAKGYNSALKQVNADYYMLLNSDVEVTPNWLNPLVNCLEKNTSFAACQPKMISFNEKGFFEYAGGAGGWIDSFGYPFARGRVFDICEKDLGQYQDTVEVFWATGAAMLIRSNIFHQLNGFDEYFFAHQEEIDLCWRMKLAGYKIFCCPETEVYHVGGGTLPRGNSKKTYLNFRNNQIMLWKNLTWREKIWKTPFRLFLDQVSAFKGLVSGEPGYFIAIVNAHLAFIYWLVFIPVMKTKERKKPLNTLTGVFNGNIVWQHFVNKKTSFQALFKNV